MRMKKKLLHVLLSMALILGSVGGVWIEPVVRSETAEAATGDGFQIEGTVLKKYTGSGTNIQIPNGITKIANSAFYYCTTVKSITIPNTVTEIGQSAFTGCENLTSISIPDSVTKIGASAFWLCENLTDLSFSDNVQSIESHLFYLCRRLTRFTISDKVTSINGTAFFGCSGLTEITVETGNEKFISENGILYTKDKHELICYPASKSENSFQIPNSVTGIGTYAFNYCKNLTGITIPGSTRHIDDWAFYRCGKLQKVNIEEGLEEIGNSAFMECEKLTDISLPDTVTKIGDYVFGWCGSLTSIAIPKNVNSMGVNPCSACSKLMAICVDEKNKNFGSEFGVLYDKSLTKIIGYPAGKTETSFRIPASVNSIEQYAFVGCRNLKEILAQNNITNIGCEAFMDCENLASFTIPDGVSILNGVFTRCKKISYIILPKTITKIEYGEFCDTMHLKDIYYGGSEEDWRKISISSYSNEKLSGVTIHYNSSGPDIVEEMDTDFVIKDGVLIKYRGTPVDGVVRIPDGVVVIGKDVFKDRTDITTVYIPRSVTEVEDGAFHGCTALKDVYYEGTEEEWRQIKIGKDNKPLTDAALHIYYISKPEDIGNTSFLLHLYRDCEHKNKLSERGIELFANGASVKSGSLKVDYKSVSLYTDITASYHYTYNSKGKQVTSTGKVVVGITTSNKIVPIVTKKNTIEDTATAKIATASVKDGKITVTAKTLPGTVYLWVIDTGDAKDENGQGIFACCPVTVRSAPTKVNLYSNAAENYDASTVKYTKGDINIGSSVYLYAFPTYSDGTNTLKTEDATYTASVDAKAAAYFTVAKMKGNCFMVTAKALNDGKKVSGNIYITCNQNGKKSTFTATAVNHVMDIGLKELSLLEKDSENDTLTISLASDKSQKRGIFKLNPVGEDGSGVVTDATPTLYAMREANSFQITSKGTVNVTARPTGNQTKLTASLAKDKKTVTVTAAKNAVSRTTVYYLVVYHTLNASGYKVITIKAE